jgi:DNA-binding beta-propeller fold protein YncE
MRNIRSSPCAIALAVLGVTALGAGCPERSDAPRGRRVEETAAAQEPRVYELSTEESEVVDVVAGAGSSLVLVASPGAACGGSGAPSHVSALRFAGGAEGSLDEAFVVDLGLGEATSVAGHPGGSFALVTVKDARKPNVLPGSLLAIEERGIALRVAVGPGPDSVAISPNGRFAVVACEAEEPDAEDCAAESATEDTAGSIHIVDLAHAPGRARVVAVITGEQLHARLGPDAGRRAPSPRAVEPEFVAISPDSSLALVTLQEQSAVAAVDLARLSAILAAGAGPSPEDTGTECLAGVTLLPHDHVDPAGSTWGVHPDGIAISPDGVYAVTANEAHPKGRHLQGISILDLRGGSREIRLLATRDIFELDPTLRASSKKTIAPSSRKARKVQAPKGKLPRLDPEGVALARVSGVPVAAIAIERRARQEDAGSVLLLDMSGVLEGEAPQRIARVVVGATSDARPETLDFSGDGRFLFVASERDGGTLTLIDVAGQLQGRPGPGRGDARPASAPGGGP